MRAKMEYSNHFDFSVMKIFNLSSQADLPNVVIVFDTKKIFLFRFEALALKKQKCEANRSKNKHYYFDDSNVYISS